MKIFLLVLLCCATVAACNNAGEGSDKPATDTINTGTYAPDSTHIPPDSPRMRNRDTTNRMQDTMQR